MNDILIDNWNMQEILCNMCDVHDFKLSQSYENLLTAIILWENIYYPQNEMSIAWNLSKTSLSKIVHPYDDSQHRFYERATEIYQNICNTNKVNSVVGQGAIRYQLLSNSLGINYLPAPKRADFLIKYNYSSNILRSHIENIVDSSVMNVFSQLNELLGENLISFKMPLLVDYIIYNSNSSSSYIDCALELKKDSAIKRYRKYLSKIEEELEQGNWTGLFNLKKDINELISDVLKLSEKHIVSANISLSIMPSINITKDINFERPKLHLTFLRSLINFAFKERKQ